MSASTTDHPSPPLDDAAPVERVRLDPDYLQDDGYTAIRHFMAQTKDGIDIVAPLVRGAKSVRNAQGQIFATSKDQTSRVHDISDFALAFIVRNMVRLGKGEHLRQRCRYTVVMDFYPVIRVYLDKTNMELQPTPDQDHPVQRLFMQMWRTYNQRSEILIVLQHGRLNSGHLKLAQITHHNPRSWPDNRRSSETVPRPKPRQVNK